MADSPFAIPTNAGLAALAAAIDSEDPVPITISEMVIGDGAGAVVDPLQSWTNLVNQRASAPIDSVVRNGNVATFRGLFDENVGPFWIREAGLRNPAGQLLFVARTPEFQKLTPVENVNDTLMLGLMLVVSATANVTLLPPPGSLVSIAQMLRAPWITVDAVANAAPSSPVVGATIRVGSSPTGAFVGQAHSLAQWTGSAWVFKAVPLTHLISQVSDGRYYRRTETGWTEWFPTGFDFDESLFHYSNLI